MTQGDEVNPKVWTVPVILKVNSDAGKGFIKNRK